MAKCIARSKGMMLAEFVADISRHTADRGHELRTAMKVEVACFSEYVERIITQRIKDLGELLDDKQRQEIIKLQKDCDRWQSELSVCKKRIKEIVQKKRVNDWITKIMKSNKTLNDLRLRNDFMSYLSMNVQSGELKAPFDQDPVRGPLKAEDEDFSMQKFLPADHGGFIIPKPAPQVGAYCYIAAFNNNT
ncbi:UNVERIFIED_CONTAM: hypothetical protein PYX00_000876 [Menopon gallinae]|uniref:DUF4485 domain-containing protein n=1 Tax=Menopon gallinae TaxID=328185 RepID=A0AAW2IBY8_9NEOP